MTTSHIATQLVERCRRADYLGAQRDLYSPDAISIEPEGSDAPTVRGLAAIHGKTKHFEETFYIKRNEVSDPIVSDPFFACTMAVDVVEKKSGQTMTLAEICVYEVKNGKIVREQFFYPPHA
jgi:hypothetical protein